MSADDSLRLAGFDLHDVLGRSPVSKPITMHWKHNGKRGCEVPVGEVEVTSIHCSAFRYLMLKDRFCSLCMEAARKALDEEAEAGWWLNVDCGVLLYAPSNSEERQ